MVSPRKVYRQLRLAHAAQATQYVYLLSVAMFVFGQEHSFKLRYFRRPVYKMARCWDALEAKVGSILSKVYLRFSYAAANALYK